MQVDAPKAADPNPQRAMTPMTHAVPPIPLTDVVAGRRPCPRKDPRLRAPDGLSRAPGRPQVGTPELPPALCLEITQIRHNPGPLDQDLTRAERWTTAVLVVFAVAALVRFAEKV
jgi:hypothetical protein